METLEKRYNKAIKDIRGAGVVFARNVRACCRSCVDLGLVDNAPVVWNFGGQGMAFTIKGDYTDTSEVYLYHGNLVANGELTSAGVRVLEIFEREGIVVNWDKSAGRAITLELSNSIGGN